MESEGMEWIFFIGFIGAIYGLMFIVNSVKNRKFKEHWLQLAQDLQLDFKGVGRLEGMFNGYQLQTQYRKVKESNKEVIYTQFMLKTSVSLPSGLKISGNEMFMTVLKLFGAQDIVVGIPMLDDPLIIKGTDPELVTQLLHRLEHKRTLVDVCSMSNKSGLNGDECTIEIKDACPSAGMIRGAVQKLQICVEDLSNAMQAVNCEDQIDVKKQFSTNSVASMLPLQVSKHFSSEQSDRLTDVLDNFTQGKGVEGLQDVLEQVKRAQDGIHMTSTTTVNTTVSTVVNEVQEMGTTSMKEDVPDLVPPEVSAEVPPAMDESLSSSDNIPPDLPQSPPVDSTVDPAILPIGDAQACLVQLQKFVTARPTKDQVKQCLEHWSGQVLHFELEFDRQSTTFEMGLDDLYRAGKTLYGKVGNLDVIMRYPEGHSKDLSAISYKDSVSVQGCLHAWDSLMRKAEFLVV